MSSLNILHVMRSPVGGLFRHVVDLARGQAERGHKVGIVADATTGAARAQVVLEELAPALAFGVVRLPMSRHLGSSDFATARKVNQHAALCGADVVHGHGAKGGAYARLTDGKRAIRVYTPHGGSLHYRKSSPVGFAYLNLEHYLAQRTELFLFESAYGRDAFRARVGTPRALTAVVHNGVGPAEFDAVAPDDDASDLLFVGELRALKGIDVLIEAVSLLRRAGRRVTATLVGEGPDAASLKARARELGLEEDVRFAGVLPARIAFRRGRLLLVPSRAESLPYIILEAAAASVPLIATDVGGIGEIFGPQASRLIAPGDPESLARSIKGAIGDPALARSGAAALRERVRSLFSTERMVDNVLDQYSLARGGESPGFAQVG